MRSRLDSLTFGAGALSVGLLVAFMVMRGNFEGMNAGAATILFGLLLAAFVATPFIVQHFVNKRVRSRFGVWWAGASLVLAAGLGFAAYGTVLLAGGDSLDAVVFMAIPLWQVLIVGLVYGIGQAVSWYKRQASRTP